MNNEHRLFGKYAILPEKVICVCAKCDHDVSLFQDCEVCFELSEALEGITNEKMYSL